MVVDSAALLAVLFFAAAGAGYLFARFTARRRRHRVPPVEFYRGVARLAERGDDDALAVLARHADADPGTVEIHMALGSLFRTRGEVERAIRLHQDLIARTDLAPDQRARALFELGEDYLRAGLFDRAEGIFEELSASDTRRVDALRLLVTIYEQQHDWDKAIETRQRLAASVPGDHLAAIAHYHCELAGEAAARHDVEAARGHLRQARHGRRGIVRGAMMRGDIARLDGDPDLALRLYERVVASDPSLAVDVLPNLMACFVDPQHPALNRVLESLAAQHPESIAPAAIAANLSTHPALAECLNALIEREPGLDVLARTKPERGGARWEAITGTLHALGLGKASYRCGDCGYVAAQLRWQCPACRSWDTIRAKVALNATT